MNLRIDTSDILIAAGFLLACLSLWQVSPWLSGALLGGVMLAVGMMRAR